MEEAKRMVTEFETEDKKDGNFEPDFYEIVVK